MKYTISQFRKEFPNEDACLDRIFALRYSQQPCCPQCSQETTFKRIPDRRCYQCSDPHCQYQLYPTAGTIFEKTRTPLVDWFYAIYLMTSTRNGVSAKELQRQLGVTYKTAFRMGHQIRKLLSDNTNIKLSGVVQVDETYIGGSTTNKHKKDREARNKKGTGQVHMMPLFAMMQENGMIRTQQIVSPIGAIIKPIISSNIEEGAIVVSDGHGAYNGLASKYDHQVVRHEKDEYVNGNKFHTNSIEGFFSHLKRTIKGTHIAVSRKYLTAYANECAFRYTYRKQGQGMFYTILSQISWEDLKPFSEAQKSPLGELDFLMRD